MSWGHLSISAISQLLLVRFGSNFKQRVRGTYTTDYNCHHDICPGNICPYQQYLSCYWPDLDQTLNKGSLEHIQQITTVTTTFVWATFVFHSQLIKLLVSFPVLFSFVELHYMKWNFYLVSRPQIHSQPVFFPDFKCETGCGISIW